MNPRQNPAARSDEGVLALTKHLAAHDTPAAMQWALALKEAGRRRTELVRLGKEWIKQYPATAKAWLNQQAMDAATKQEILGAAPAASTETDPATSAKRPPPRTRRLL